MNGYTNYETWATVLWIDNEEWSYHAAREIAEERDKDSFADWVIEVYMGLRYRTGSLEQDLLECALEHINWTEVYEHFKED